MIRKLLSTVAAIGLAGGIAYGANVPLQTGPLDPGNQLGNINAALLSINTWAPGIVAVNTTAAASTATTAEQTLFSVTIPANTLVQQGQTLRLRCAGQDSGGAGTKAPKLYFGTSSISAAAAANAGSNWELELAVTYNASATSTVQVGRGTVGTTVIAPVATANNTDDLRTGLTAKCTTTQSVASASDTIGVLFLIEQEK